jgi:hypothetical protein
VWGVQREEDGTATTLRVGQDVNVSCNIYPGAFPSEYLVILEAQDGEYSGFVQVEHVTPSPTEKNQGSIEGIVREIEGDRITVQLPGQYFTTATGLTTFPASWANKNIRAARAIMQGPSKKDKDGDYLKKDCPTQPPESHD